MPEPKQNEKQNEKTYTVLEDAFFGCVFKEEGSEIKMTETEAEYYVPHILKLKKRPAPKPTAKAPDKE